MTRPCLFKWAAVVVLFPIVLAVLFVAIFGWNWLRGPIERMTTEKTGRALAINGDLKVKFGWPLPRITIGAVTFANPGWARNRQMITADAVEITIDLPQLLLQHIVFPEVWLMRPVVFLERGGNGQKNWLMDLNQQNEKAHIQIDRLSFDHGTLGYDDSREKTSIQADISTPNTLAGDNVGSGIVFTAQGQYKGLSFKAHGSGGHVLAMQDEDAPYALKVYASVGHTTLRADGTITNLLKFSAMDMNLALSGDSLEQLFPLLGIAFPVTHPYATQGHLLHNGKTWRYEKFSGRIGASDIAGSLQIDTSGKRPTMKAELVSNLLDFSDLGPLIGEKPGSVQAAKQAPSSDISAVTTAQVHVLPDIPFKTDRWDSVDAEVTLKARTIRRAKALPVDDLVTHLSLHDSVLTLDPLIFGIAGGHLDAVISLDGRKDPIQARAQAKVRKILIAKLFPTIKLSSTSIGQVNGVFDLTGRGNSVGRMLAESNGKIGLVLAGGEVSKMMMEEVGLHLWEILELNVTGDKLIKLRCMIADFDVKEGIMHANALIFDTQITTIIGTGSIDLGHETLNLTLNQNTKDTSYVALRSPIYIRGTFARPEIEVDKGTAITRALGAIAMGVVNPLLAFLPLIDAGPGSDSDCATN